VGFPSAAMHLVLYEPEIPPNTGSVARLCAATKTPLHLIEPLGFSLDDRYLKRAGLDYWPHVDLSVWPDFGAYLAAVNPSRVVVSSARQGEPHHVFRFEAGDAIVLGPETRGLPAEVLAAWPLQVRIPIWGEVRSLNMAGAACVLLYEGLRQTGGLDGR
jgi:tRNA (cytidine/uridine-2'-O-)-methyltransferase